MSSNKYKNKSPIERRSSPIKLFLNQMRTKCWFENIKIITNAESITEVSDFFSNLGTYGDDKSKYDNWKKYASGEKTPKFSTIVDINELVPGTAETFLIGPNKTPIWSSLSDKIHVEDVAHMWIESIKWPKIILENESFQSIIPPNKEYIFYSTDKKTNYYYSLETLELFYKINIPSFSSYDYTNHLAFECEAAKKTPPELTFWDELIRIILSYRMNYNDEKQELITQTREIEWCDHLNIEVDNDYHHEDALDQFGEKFQNYSFLARHDSSRKELQDKLIHLLNSNQSILKKFGLYPRDFIFLMRQLHSEIRMKLPFPKRKKLKNWTSPISNDY